jgi:hypothetical protein
LYTYLSYIKRRDSSAGIATGYGLDGRDSIPSRVIKIGSWAHLVSYPMFTAGFIPGVKADHTPPSSAEVKNAGAIPPLRHMSSWHSA